MCIGTFTSAQTEQVSEKNNTKSKLTYSLGKSFYDDTEGFTHGLDYEYNFIKKWTATAFVENNIVPYGVNSKHYQMGLLLGRMHRPVKFMNFSYAFGAAYINGQQEDTEVFATGNTVSNGIISLPEYRSRRIINYYSGMVYNLKLSLGFDIGKHFSFGLFTRSIFGNDQDFGTVNFYTGVRF